METKLFSCKGRIRRSTYWSRIIVATGINMFGYIMGKAEHSVWLLLLLSAMYIIVAVFTVIQGIKRMHDVGKSGWYLLIPIYSLILCFTEGITGTNEYGVNPKEKILQEDEIYNAITALLISTFFSCIIYGFFSVTKIVDGLTVGDIIKNALFIISFVTLSFVLMQWDSIKKSKKNIDI